MPPNRPHRAGFNYIQPAPLMMNFPPGLKPPLIQGSQRLNPTVVKNLSPHSTATSSELKNTSESSNPTIIVYIPPPIITSPLVSPASKNLENQHVQTLSAARLQPEQVTLPSITLPTMKLPSLPIINLPTFPPLTMPPAFDKLLTTKSPEETIVYRPISRSRNSDEEESEEKVIYRQKKRKEQRHKQTRHNKYKEVLEETEPLPMTDENAVLNEFFEAEKFPSYSSGKERRM